MKTIEEILRYAVENKASDVHLCTGLPPMVRILGRVFRLESEQLSHDTLDAIFLELLNETQKKQYSEKKEIDLALTFPAISRVRINIYHHFRGISAALRILPSQACSLEALRLPPSLKQLSQRRKGLILVTGPSGSGKSSTLAAIVNEINRTRQEHIISIEDPIEYLHEAEQCIIHQREIGVHTRSFAEALRSALREDPDVILVGEMRDLETITLALLGAETGHLVLSTLHTNSAAEAVERIIDVFPSGQQQQIRSMLANTLTAVLSQRLIPKGIEQERVPLVEVLIGTPAVQNLIREGKTHQLLSFMQAGRQFGMQTFEQSFRWLMQQNLLSPHQKLSDYL